MPDSPSAPTAPPLGTRERWAWDYIHATSFAAKLSPGRPPPVWEQNAPARRLTEPGRPPELRVLDRAEKTRGLQSPTGRARALHTFLHHELQAAELMAWAVLAFPSAPAEFREGLLRIALDETRHMAMYAEHIERLGHRLGEFPVRDWFWLRVPSCKSPAEFVAVMGLGLESANLDHSLSFAARFREAGDEEGARLQEVIGAEEIGHVRFGARWFEAFTGGLDFSAWSMALPPPLSPLLMRGRVLAREARHHAGQPARFVEELEQWSERPPGS